MAARAEAYQLVRVSQVGAALIILPFKPSSDPPAALLGPACLQVGKLPCISILSLTIRLLGNGARLCIPNVGCIFGNRSVAGEFSGASHI